MTDVSGGRSGWAYRRFREYFKRPSDPTESATVPLDADGDMSVFARMRTHLIGDVAGHDEAVDAPIAAGRIVPLAPTRVFDTRESGAAGGPKGFVPAESSIAVQIAGEGEVPSSGVAAVILNLTATQSAGPNFVTAHPRGTTRPTPSSLNLGLGETTANLATVPLGDGGMIDLFTKTGSHLLADTTGYYLGQQPSCLRLGVARFGVGATLLGNG